MELASEAIEQHGEVPPAQVQETAQRPPDPTTAPPDLAAPDIAANTRTNAQLLSDDPVSAEGPERIDNNGEALLASLAAQPTNDASDALEPRWAPAVGEEIPAKAMPQPVEGEHLQNPAGSRFTQRQNASEAAGDLQASFLKPIQPKAQSRWRVWLRGAWVLLLVIGLAFQWVVYQRERIAASAPALVPVLQMLCQWTGCEIGPLREIESVVIESSSFVKVKTDVYRLSFSIKNTALVPLALPFAELTLTDLRDQSVLRRVVSPVDYGARGETLAPGEELSLVVPVAVKAAGGIGEKITGYRLLVFYP